ncbi:MAG TPA: TetR/AcrR family transcriptional regulator [Solirubrobacteraceae bacterium]|nr:TetR/AcrR family transcriptional regulator [Solirubrobacteraceae bacterium]
MTEGGLREGAIPTERRYGGRTADERRAERRSRLLEAGHELFGTRGYAASTIEAVCAEASLNARYFYEQFRHREELLHAVYTRQAHRVLDAVRNEMAGESDPARRLEAALRAFVQAMLLDERGMRIVYLEAVGVSATLEEERRRVGEAYVQVLSREASRLPRLATVGAQERRAIVIALMGATDGLVCDWLASEQRPPASSIVERLLAIFGPILA